MINHYQAIIFDLVGPVLIKKNEILDPLTSEVNELCGDAKEEQVFWEEIVKKFNLSEIEIQSLIKRIANHFEKNLPIWEFLEKVKGKYKFGMINNGTKTIFEILSNKYDFAKYFDVLVNSIIFGVKKPDPRIYLHACDLLQVKPEDCIFVDDDLVNVLGAEKVGMKGILYDSKKHGEFLEEMNKIFLLK
jgi:FMN phosphatase YigB (HAD superfamily)